jgi:hypothetical protein
MSRRESVVPTQTLVDLYPIEQVFPKQKALARNAALRSLDTVSDAIATKLTAISPRDCADYLRNSGYACA